MKKRVILFALIILMAFGLVPAGTQARDELVERHPTGLLEFSEAEGLERTSSPQTVNMILDCNDWGQIETRSGDMWICFVGSEEFLILVNGDNYLGRGHSPDDLVPVGDGQRLRAGAAHAFLRMQDSMNADGLYLTVRSGYRPYGDQQYLFNRAVANWGLETALRWWARPGHSEHQTGLALDILQRGHTGSSLNSARFENTQQYEWLMENAHNYGFIMRYPAEYESITGIAFEPWHWRYIGVESATYMKENGFTVFEKYIEHRETNSIED